MRISDWSSDVCSSDLAGSQPAHDGKRRRKWNTKTPTSTRWIFRRGAVWRRINWQCSFISDSRRPCSMELKSLSLIRTLASRFNVRLKGSRLLEPTVDNVPPTVATLPCKAYGRATRREKGGQ